MTTWSNSRRWWITPAVSLVLSVASLVCFHLYAWAHWRVFYALPDKPGLEEARRVWSVLGHLKLVSAVLAVPALVLAAASLRRPRNALAIVAIVLAALACALIPLVT